MTKNLKILFLLLVSGMGLVPVQATMVHANHANEATQQTEDCKGVIKDATGETVIGASIRVKDGEIGTITDLNGNFVLPGVKKGQTLIVSFIGYQTQEIVWNGTFVNVTLKEDTQTLDEVVVVGFGSQKKANLTGSVSQVKMDDVLGDRPLRVSRMPCKVRCRA